jgi:hypothetical protein
MVRVDRPGPCKQHHIRFRQAEWLLLCASLSSSTENKNPTAFAAEPGGHVTVALGQRQYWDSEKTQRPARRLASGPPAVSAGPQSLDPKEELAKGTGVGKQSASLLLLQML